MVLAHLLRVERLLRQRMLRLWMLQLRLQLPLRLRL